MKYSGLSISIFAHSAYRLPTQSTALQLVGERTAQAYILIANCVTGNKDLVSIHGGQALGI